MPACGKATRRDGEPTARTDERSAPAAARKGRLTARPRGRVRGTPAPGLRALAGNGRDALLYVPGGDRPARRRTLVLTLHGAGGSPRNGIGPLLPLADEAGLILLAPKSRAATWDVVREGYGPDVAFIDRMLALAFSRLPVDPRRVAIAGFSDGASYALSLGLTNGDLFGAVVAFSPGFMTPAGQRGLPRVFVSHGTSDPVLPIAATSRRLVPELRGAGYEVRYREFGGGHTVPPGIAREADRWLVSG